MRRAVYGSTGAICELRPVSTHADATQLLHRRPDLQVLAVGSGATSACREAAAKTVQPKASAPTVELPPGDGSHVVKSSMTAAGAHVVSLLGNSPRATLFAVYTFAERELGAQFLLSGDVFPPHEPTAGEPPRFAPQDISMSTSFKVRGIQPFHDFTSGPDWWSKDDYKAIMTQLVKQKLNFIGLHSYPDQEPLVWLGDPKDLTVNGDVKPAGGYPTAWRTSECSAILSCICSFGVHFKIEIGIRRSALDSNWGMKGRNTSEYLVGAKLAYPAQCYGSPAMTTTQPWCIDPALPHPPYGEPNVGGAAEAATFNAAADLVADAFKFGGKLGILRAVYFESTHQLHIE
eukprot:SAG31_NODE_2729_length_5177_cov_2.657542_5_plen_346_part_00